MTLEIIAEISGCHGGVRANAIDLINRAARAGATGVKFQCFQPERLAMRRANHPRIETAAKAAGAADMPLLDLYRQIWTPWDWFPEMILAAEDRGLTWHTSVFDPEDVKVMETLNCPRYKIASFEAGNADIMQEIFRTGKPIVMSVNQNEDITPPLGDVTVLHATDYGVLAKDANLARLRQWHDGHVIAKLSRTTHWKWGLSDHTESDIAAEIAVLLGACMVEWHLRLSTVHTPDDAFSHTVNEFAFKARRVKRIYESINA